MSLSEQEIRQLLALRGRVAELESEVTSLNDEIAQCLKEKGHHELNSLELKNTREPALEIVQRNITGADNQAIDISVGEALDAEEHWTGIRIKPDRLDPSGADARIRGLAVNLSGVDTTNIPESMNGLRIIMPAGLTGVARDAVDAIFIDNGDIDHNFDVPDTAYSTFTAYDLVLDAADLAANSEIHGFDITTAGGTPSGKIAAISSGTYIDPIHQHIGTYSTPSQTEYAGRKTGGGSTWADGVDAQEVFVQNSDEVYIGSTAKFSELEVIMTTEATKHIGLEFYFNTAADTWTQFYPADDTIGFQQSGLIRWEEDDLATWTNNGDPGGDDSSAGYWVKLVRTSGPDPGTPTPTTIKTGTTTLYEWDKDGDVVVKTLSAETLDLSQIADADAIQINGYDDKSGSHLKLYVGSDGNGYLLADADSGIVKLYLVATDDIRFQMGDTAGAYRVEFMDSNSVIVANLDSTGALKLKEKASASGDTAGFGQLWIKNTTPCELWFTDDAGTDTKLA